ncbi:MAG: hypothetical protein U0235_28545 [Polyangiaceae bacterium]
MKRRAPATLAVVLAAAACGARTPLFGDDESSEGIISIADTLVDGAPPGDGAAAGDGAILGDGAARDGAVGDAALRDASTVDARTTDGSAVDASVIDAGAVEILATGQLVPNDIAVDGTTVYWVNVGQSAATGSVVKMAKSGPGMGSVLTLAGARDYPGTIAVDATQVYWTEGSGPTIGGVFAVSRGGGSVTTLAQSASAKSVAVDATYVYWVTVHGQIPGAGTVMRVSRTGGAATTLVTGETSPVGLALDNARAYWVGGNQAGVVKTLRKTDSSVMTLLANEAEPYQIAVAQNRLVFINQGDGTVRTVRTDGTGRPCGRRAFSDPTTSPPTR